MLTTIEKPAVQARREIATVLRRYRLTWMKLLLIVII